MYNIETHSTHYYVQEISKYGLWSGHVKHQNVSSFLATQVN